MVDKFYIKEALKLIEKIGACNLTRDALAAHFNISAGSFAHTMGVSYGEFMEALTDHIPLEQLSKGSAYRLLPCLRKRQVLACAVELARECYYWKLTAQQVADAADISKANLARLYTLAQLKEAVIRWAIANDDSMLLAQARTANDPLLAE